MTGTERLRAELCDFISQPEFPCVGAKSALGREQIAVFAGGDIRCPSDDVALLEAIYGFLGDYETSKKMFTSFAAIFEGPDNLDEEQFEAHLWARLGALHKLDARRFDWSTEVNRDPAAPDFGFSLGGHAFFVVGLHPGASRTARQALRPTIIFNLHEQFQDLRARGQYHRIKETILERDEKLDGRINPMIAEHGQESEARQYSGREVGDDWRCPFAAAHD
ncbi:MAG: YqcI/YcgG family protein [Parvibaculum sp.]|uniref:guanitoxin biosynthesis heme-dependent pre-guanitoxin N-hydroxylase GntA n=1 Tax=Parvibaculum sp. TaxID=2024848 RepID=UPI0025F52D54|nr:guanitoxin biosynthesis heme-dependent pre-guanitoxin N-hydroxylase GntA [Parvibaculum sp.]MCE9648705.1 YqcI/YcgG family protein [Parvibaculum sp.]